MLSRKQKTSEPRNPNSTTEEDAQSEQTANGEAGASNDNNLGLRKYLLSLGLLFITPFLVSAWQDSTKLPLIGYVASAFQDKANGDSTIQERMNVALVSNGGTASASSSKNDNYPPGAVIDGDRKGLGWGAGAGWADGTPGVFPDWIQVDFSGDMIIDEIDVITLQDAWWNPSEPTETMTAGNNGITRFDVQYWGGSDWVTVPGGSVTGNTKVWRKFTFSAVTTDKIRVFIHAGRISISTLVEVEAYGVPVPPPPPTPTPEPSATPTPEGTDADLASRDIYFDPENNVGFGTPHPIFNDDGITGGFVGKWMAIDGKLPGASAYLGLGGTIPNPGDRVGVLNFYNRAMGGVDNRTAAIFSFNGPQLGTGNLEFYTTPNTVGPIRRMQIGPTGEVGINHAAGVGTTLAVMGKSADATTKGLTILDAIDRVIMTVRSDGQMSLDKPGQGLVLKSPDGRICRKLTIDNTGALVVQPMGSCP